MSNDHNVLLNSMNKEQCLISVGHGAVWYMSKLSEGKYEEAAKFAREIKTFAERLEDIAHEESKRASERKDDQPSVGDMNDYTILTTCKFCSHEAEVQRCLSVGELDRPRRAFCRTCGRYFDVHPEARTWSGKKNEL